MRMQETRLLSRDSLLRASAARILANSAGQAVQLGMPVRKVAQRPVDADLDAAGRDARQAAQRQQKTLDGFPRKRDPPPVEERHGIQVGEEEVDPDGGHALAAAAEQRGQGHHLGRQARHLILCLDRIVPAEPQPLDEAAVLAQGRDFDRQCLGFQDGAGGQVAVAEEAVMPEVGPEGEVEAEVVVQDLPGLVVELAAGAHYRGDGAGARVGVADRGVAADGVAAIVARVRNRVGEA